jgi:hypothetical protein
MLTKRRLLFKWDAASGLQSLPWQLIATAAIFIASLLLAFRADDFMIWQLTKGISLACVLNFFRIISQINKN